MDLNEKFSAMKIAYDMSFKNAFQTAPSTYEQYCMTVGDSAHTTVKLPFLEQFACMRRWIGPRQVKNLEGKVITLEEQAYEDTIGIKVRDIETDNWGMYMPSIQQLAANGKALWDKLATDALCAAGTWIDNKPFFSASHKYGESTINNTTTAALSATSYAAARAAMLAYTGHKKEPLAVNPNILMVGPALERTAWNLLVNEWGIDSTGKVTAQNEFKGTAQVLLNPRLVGEYANYWFLLAAGGPIKPVAIQKSKDPVLVSKNQPTDEGVFMEGMALFGTSAYGSAAAAFPHLVYGGIAAA